MNPNKEDILKKYSWTVIEGFTSKPVEINNSGRPSTDIFSQESACSNDDIYFFKESSDLLIDNSDITCDLPKTMTGAWRFLGDDSLIVNHPMGAIWRCKIVSMNKKEMKLRMTFDYLPKGVDVTYTFKSN